jgi:gluconolactonase
MARAVEPNSQRGLVFRRSLFQATAGIAVMGPALAFGQQAKLRTPPSVITTPARQWGRGAAPEIYPDPDIIVIDDSFNKYLLGINAIHRVWTGGLWAEGPAWSSQGQYLVFSDVQANLQHRFMWDSRSTATFRASSNNSNGNSFDFQGRQLSTEDLFRRVIRWENDGSMTVIADSFDGKKLNSSNDLVPHPDGSIWFTDPYYGDSLSEGHPEVAGGASNPLHPAAAVPAPDTAREGA